LFRLRKGKGEKKRGKASVRRSITKEKKGGKSTTIIDACLPRTVVKVRGKGGKGGGQTCFFKQKGVKGALLFKRFKWRKKKKKGRDKKGLQRDEGEGKAGLTTSPL